GAVAAGAGGRHRRRHRRAPGHAGGGVARRAGRLRPRRGSALPDHLRGASRHAGVRILPPRGRLSGAGALRMLGVKARPFAGARRAWGGLGGHFGAPHFYRRTTSSASPSRASSSTAALSWPWETRTARRDLLTRSP